MVQSVDTIQVPLEYIVHVYAPELIVTELLPVDSLNVGFQIFLYHDLDCLEERINSFCLQVLEVR